MRITGQRNKRAPIRGVGVKQIHSHFGYCRAAYYKVNKAYEQGLAEEQAVLKLVQREKALQPRVSGKKLYKLIRKEMAEMDIKMGRDKLYELLNKYNLLVAPLRKGMRTTDSDHEFRRHPNLLIDMEIERPNQVWVADITYVRTLSGFLYLSLIMDAYSRKIVGWHMHDTLELDGCLAALKMALKGLAPGQAQGITHHSDQGVQYCSHAYTGLLRENKMQISMANVGCSYENPQAERLNGILKQEYGLGDLITSKTLALSLCRQAVHLYNTRRPHLALGMAFPAEVHEQGHTFKVRMTWPKRRNHKVA